MERPADGTASCVECREITRRLKEAYTERCLLNQAAKDALDALVGGTEEDAERAEKLLATYKYHPNPGLQNIPERLRTVFRQASLHLVRTGHFVRIAYR
jgi:hypothetical protein